MSFTAAIGELGAILEFVKARGLDLTFTAVVIAAGRLIFLAMQRGRTIEARAQERAAEIDQRAWARLETERSELMNRLAKLEEALAQCQADCRARDARIFALELQVEGHRP